MTGAPDLAQLRVELDELDAELRDVLRRRLHQCVRIGRYKQENDISVMQPDRVSAVREGAAAYAAAHGLDPDFLRQLYDLIIAEACRLEDQLMAETGAPRS
ncbi:chorismate mutase [Actinoplanes siamensis]|uniref:Chorismate mutase domain-containing protein n=1 Tax=Actinoplanes siamensis TaxID=1223317 RepID=A0A919NEE7_9ACTN|nr:chorismate mutase family protein [Actinoplanes siamensis]GIF09361.1 hypothetical protein Asi03nite_68990 [Actinoplanes siamensis]